MKFLLYVLKFKSKLSVQTCSSMSKFTFTMSVNPVLGKTEWVKKPEHYDYYQEVARSSYADMLHDEERNVKYHAAIKKAIKEMKAQGRMAKVLDIGTGTGLLAMMAARAGADTVTACEAFAPVEKCARCVIKANGFEDRIEIIPKHSTELTVGPDGDLKEKANILVAEVFDTELIGEGALKTFRHALDNLLEAECIVIPSSATIYVQVVDSPLVSSWNKLSPLTLPDGRVIHPPRDAAFCPGQFAFQDVQLSQVPQHAFTALTEPTHVFQFSFVGDKSIEMNETSIKQVPVVRSGNCDVVFMWWQLKMDMEGDILLNNAPTWAHPQQAQWRDHWMQAIFYLPETVEVSKGDKVMLASYHDEWSLWFEIHKSSQKTIPEESPTNKCLIHLSHSHARIGMKNDLTRSTKYMEMLQKVIRPDSVCLCVSDGSLLPLMAAGAKKVFAIEPIQHHCDILKSYLEDNNINNVRIISKEVHEILEEDLEGEKINVVLAEPYFVNSVYPWELMRLWHLRSVLHKWLAPDPIVVPQTGRLKAAAVHFEHLWKIRAPVKNVEGFDLSKFDEMIQRAMSITDSAVEPHPLWEYPCRALSQPFDILELDFSQSNFTQSLEKEGEVPISNSSVCNGVALWTEYSFEGVEIYNGPVQPIQLGQPIEWSMNCQQGVYFIQPPDKVSPQKHILKFKMKFDVSDTTISFALEEL